MQKQSAIRSTANITARHVLGAIAALALMASSAEAKMEQAGAATVVFTASGPAGMTIEGKSSTVQVVDAGETITIVVPLAGLVTGIALRDRHMRDKYLEVQKYPNAELKVARSALTLPADGQSNKAGAQGAIKLHGVEKDGMPFSYSVKRAGSKYEVSGRVNLNMNDFGITVPSYLGVTVKPNLVVDLTFSAQDN